MEEVAVAAQLGKPATLLKTRVLIACGVGIAAVFWFMAISHWLGVRPGAVIVTHYNVLFDSDSSLWLERMMGNARSSQQSVHPLELIWRYPCRALAHLARLFMPSDYASIFGPRLLVALIAGSGVGFLSYLALYFGVPWFHFVFLFASYFLFTSNVTIALPEHFGISNGLLCIAFVVFVVVAGERLRNGILAVLAVICGGISALNFALPAWCLFESVIKSASLKARLRIAAIPLGLGAAVAFYRFSASFHKYFDGYAHFRLFRRPMQAFVYGVHMLIWPAVGGQPFLKGPQGQACCMVSYDTVVYDLLARPLDFSEYYHIQVVGAVLWLILLARSVQTGFRDVETRPYVKVALLWVLFNLAFYSIWGREPFLFTSAWSWTLMALVLLGARHLSRTFLTAMVLPMAACQLLTLHEIGSLLQTITG
jgi:hypothetical protein